MTPRPYTITLRYVSGEPTGLLIAKHTAWRGIALAFPRVLLADARRDRDELKKPGVYMLSGDRRLYIGCSDAVGKRLSEHDTKTDTKKDFWNRAVVFVSETDRLNKGHVAYMEAELIRSLREDGVALENKNAPKHSPLSEEDATFADGFIEDILLLLPLVGVYHSVSDHGSLEADKPEYPVTDASSETVPTTVVGPLQQGDYTMKVADGIATLSKTDEDGVLVHKGSQAVLDASDRFAVHRSRQAELRRDLVESGVLAPNGDHRVFTRDQRFDSMGKAASVIRGSNTLARVWTATKAGIDE